MLLISITVAGVDRELLGWQRGRLLEPFLYSCTFITTIHTNMHIIASLRTCMFRRRSTGQENRFPCAAILYLFTSAHGYERRFELVRPRCSCIPLTYDNMLLIGDMGVEVNHLWWSDNTFFSRGRQVLLRYRWRRRYYQFMLLRPLIFRA